jgi:hypothetical protein
MVSIPIASRMRKFPTEETAKRCQAILLEMYEISSMTDRIHYTVEISRAG